MTTKHKLAQTYNMENCTPLNPPEYEPFEFLADSGTEKPSATISYADVTFASDHPIRTRGAGNEIDDRPRWFHAYSPTGTFGRKRYGCLFAIASGDLASTGRMFTAFNSKFPLADCEAYTAEDENFIKRNVLVIPLAKPVSEEEWLEAQATIDGLMAEACLTTDRTACFDSNTKIPLGSFAASREASRYTRIKYRLQFVNR